MIWEWLKKEGSKEHKDNYKKKGVRRGGNQHDKQKEGKKWKEMQKEGGGQNEKNK